MQKQRELEPNSSTGRKSADGDGSHQALMAMAGPTVHDGVSLEEMLSSDNMKRAWQQVKGNKGAAGELC